MTESSTGEELRPRESRTGRNRSEKHVVILAAGTLPPGWVDGSWGSPVHSQTTKFDAFSQEPRRPAPASQKPGLTGIAQSVLLGSGSRSGLMDGQCGTGDQPSGTLAFEFGAFCSIDVSSFSIPAAGTGTPGDGQSIATGDPGALSELPGAMRDDAMAHSLAARSGAHG